MHQTSLLAAFHGHVESVRFLIEAQVNVDLAKVDDGVTPLYLAVQRGHVELVRLLINSGDHCISRLGRAKLNLFAF